MEHAVRLEGYTRAERHAMTVAAADAIDVFGWLTDFKQFSNIAIVLHFEISPRHLGDLASSLRSLDVTFTGPSGRWLDEIVDREPSEGDEPVQGSLVIHFIQTEARVEAPLKVLPDDVLHR